MTPTRQFTDDEIRELVPEVIDTVKAWLTSHIPAHREMAELLLATRLELKEARERLADPFQAVTCPDCLGSGHVSFGTNYCERCQGHGRVLKSAPPETQAPSLAGKRTLDLRGLTTNAAQFDQTIWLSKLLEAIRAQRPDVEVIV